MSRIHEALKRAEQEKTANEAVKTAEEYVAQNSMRDTLERPAVHSAILQSVIVPPQDMETAHGQLQAEDLWARCARPAWNPDPALLVFNNSSPFAPGAEQFRTLRSRLYRIREAQTLRTILISSAIPAEGKTFVAANLAHVFSRQPGCKVLLIDADLRSPRLHKLFGAPDTPGLADYLQGGTDEFKVIQRGFIEGLYFVPAGKQVTHPAELISNGLLKRLLGRLSTVFDWIVLDSPPALPVADASVLAGMCDGLLFVVRAGSTPYQTSQRACQELKDARVLGVVLNGMEDGLGYGPYYGYGGYGEGNSSGSEK